MPRRPWWLVLVLVALVSAAAGSAHDEVLERNRQRLAKADPEQQARLLQELRDFHALPAERQRQLRELDARLHAGDADTQARLWGVLERYAAWLDRLPEEARRSILESPPAERLAIIRRMREEEWLASLPAKVRADLNNLPAEKPRRIAAMRAEERRARRGLMPAGPRPEKLSDMPADVQRFINDHLMPALPRKEKEALAKAEGRWPDYPRQVRSLTDRFLVLRPLPGGPITSWDALVGKLRPPPMMKDKGKGKSWLPKGVKHEWPDFALALTEISRRPKGPLTGKFEQLGACKPAHYPEPIREFIEKRLMPAMPEKERDALQRLEGQWPEYPRALEMAGRRMRMAIPGITLPGPAEIWEAVRGGG